MAFERTIVVNVQTEQVIRAVQARPVIWDPTHNDYKDAELRLAAWREISEELIDGFDMLNRHVKKAAVKKIQQRWRTARDSYTKTRTTIRKSGGGKVKMYIHHDMMTFLDHSESRTDLNASEESDDEEVTSDPLMPEEKETRSGKRKLEESQSDGEESGEPPKTWTVEMAMDEDWSFFNSIMPTLRKLTNLQKLKFRSKVLNLLIDVEQGTSAERSFNADCSSNAGCSSSYVKFEK